MTYVASTVKAWACLDLFQQQLCFAVITARLTLNTCADTTLVELLAGTFFGIQRAVRQLQAYYTAFHLVPVLPDTACPIGGVIYETAFADALLVAQAQGKLVPHPQTCAQYRIGRGDGIGV